MRDPSAQRRGSGRVRRVVGVGAAGVLLTGLVAFAATPAELYSLDVDRNGGRFELVAETYLAADADAIFEVLTDYEDGRFGRISSVYIESDYLEPAPDGTPLVYTLMEGCVTRLFCKTMRRVERLEVEEPHLIRTLALPEHSDFDYASSEFVLTPVEGGTEVTYRLVVDPDFLVPLGVGWILKRVLASGGERALYRIERLARGLPSGLDPSQGVDATLAEE